MDRVAPAPDKIIARAWPHDTGAALLVKAAVSPSTLADMTATSVTVIPEFLGSLGGVSAGAALLAEGLTLAFDHGAVISLPAFVADANAVTFVSEGQPLPVRQFAITTPPPQLVPRKMGVLTSLTRETIEGSNAEALVRNILMRSTALAIDKFLFDDQPGDDTRPPGLRYNVAASTASANADRNEALLEDITTLVGAVSAVGSNIVLVTSPARAITAQLRAKQEFPAPILGSAAIADDVLAIAVDALASATDAVPVITASREATVHHDTTPAQIGTAGTPAVVAAPTISVFPNRQRLAQASFRRRLGFARLARVGMADSSMVMTMDQDERERRRQVIEQARATVDRLKTIEATEAAFAGPEPIDWRMRPAPNPVPARERGLDTMPAPPPPSTDVGELIAATIAEERRFTRKVVAHALADLLAQQRKALRVEIAALRRQHDELRAMYDTLVLQQRELRSAQHELRCMYESDHAKIIDMPSPLPPRRNVN
jgi:hypothetical protein